MSTQRSRCGPTATIETSVIDVVVDASIAIGWFRDADEIDVAASRELLECHRDRLVGLFALDLSIYEVGNALLRGRARALPSDAATVMTAIRTICRIVAPDERDFVLAAELAHSHNLTLYDAAYGAVARHRSALLATLDRELLRAGLGQRPADIVSLARA